MEAPKAAAARPTSTPREIEPRAPPASGAGTGTGAGGEGDAILPRDGGGGALARTVGDLPIQSRIVKNSAHLRSRSAAGDSRVELVIPGCDAACVRWIRTHVTKDGVLGLDETDDPAQRVALTPRQDQDETAPLPISRIFVHGATTADHAQSALREAARAAHEQALQLDGAVSTLSGKTVHPGLQHDVHAAHAMPLAQLRGV